MNQQSKSLVSVFPLDITFKSSFDKRAFSVFFLGIIISLFVFLILQINAYTREMYLVQEQEKRMEELGGSNRNLEINVTKATSLNNLGIYLENQFFEKASKIEYVRVLGETALAK